MPFAPHIRMSALGRLGVGTPERFSYSLNLAAGGSQAPFLAPNQTVWEDLAEDFATFHGSIGARIDARAVLEQVKFARIGADGKYTEDPVVIDLPDVPGGINATNNSKYGTTLPQSALVCSLMTDRRGATGRGRIYLPMPVIDVGDDLRIADAQRDIVQASFAAFVDALGDQPGADVLDLVVVVASSKGYNSEVTGVRVGRVLDTVRSRRRSLDEAYDPITPITQG